MDTGIIARIESIPVLDAAVVSELTGMLGADGYSGLAQRMFNETDQALATFTLPTNDGEFASLKDRAHKLAGSAATLGAKRMHQILKALEASCKNSDPMGAQKALDALPNHWSETKTAMCDPQSFSQSA